MSYKTRRNRIIAALIILQAPTVVGLVIVGNYSASALGVIMFAWGAMAGYMAALHLEQPPARPHIEAPTTRRELVIYEVTGREVM